MTRDLSLSFEFFPPRTPEGREKLRNTCSELAAFDPEYCSVTYGAAGSTRDFTRDLVLELQAMGFNPAPHLSFGTDDEEEIESLVQSYADAGVDRMVALRGDAPAGSAETEPVYACELVKFVRERFGDHFDIGVACYPEVHPEAQGYQEDVGYLKQKMDAGADYAITQYFYNSDAFSEFMDVYDQAGIEKPVVPGIMPIVDADNLMRFSEACGADIPRWLRKGIEDHREDTSDLVAYGEDVVTRLCERLIDQGVDGFHFYTLNQSKPTASICQNLMG